MAQDDCESAEFCSTPAMNGSEVGASHGGASLFEWDKP